MLIKKIVKQGYALLLLTSFASLTLANDRLAPVIEASELNTITPGYSVGAIDPSMHPFISSDRYPEQTFIQGEIDDGQNALVGQRDFSQQDAYDPRAVRGLSNDQRLARIEQILANMETRNIISQLETMQQQLQDVQGRLEVQAHELNTLKAQQRDLYADLDDRIAALSGDTGSAATNTQPSAPIVSDPRVSGQPNQETSRLQEQGAYEQAYAYIRNKQYGQAVNAMQAYLSNYPKGQYAPNAYYWLGELHLISGDMRLAKQSFNQVVTAYPTHDKAADSLLKLGLAAYEENNISEAMAYFTQVIADFPASSSARLAEQRIAEIQRTGY